MSERRKNTTKTKGGDDLRSFLNDFSKDKPLPELWQSLKTAVLQSDRWNGLAEHRGTKTIADDGSLVDHQHVWAEAKSEIVSAILRHGISQGAIASYCEQVLAEKKEADLRATPGTHKNRIESVNAKTQRQGKPGPNEPLKNMLRILAKKYHDATQRELLGHADDLAEKQKIKNVIPQTWCKAGATSLVSAYDSEALNNTVKRFVSVALKKK